jgi:hypothetical protein
MHRHRHQHTALPVDLLRYFASSRQPQQEVPLAIAFAALPNPTKLDRRPSFLTDSFRDGLPAVTDCLRAFRLSSQ